MTQFLHSIHSLHQYAFLPIILFLVAFIVVLASYNGKTEPQRWFGYLLAVGLVVSSVLIIHI